MRVAVIGAGAIGGLYGGLMARAGHEVSLLARGEGLRAIQQRGLKIQSAEFGEFTITNIRASNDPHDLGTAELVLFAVKTYDLEGAARAASQILAPTGHLLTFQNGLDTPDRLAVELGEDRVLVGTTGLEVTALEPGVIGHLSKMHYVFIGALHGPPTRAVESTVETLRGAGINASVVEDGHRALWEKAVILIPMATITSVCRAPIGPIRDLPETHQLVDALLQEVTAVAAAYGYDMLEQRDRARGIIMEGWAYDGKASMARDFERGKRTELDAITGALVRMADARGVPVPVARTAYALLKLREQWEAGAQKGVGLAAAER
jgi:2-dehydropantoate 2-reductase